VKHLLTLLFLCFFGTSLFATEKPNVLFISIDGLSRETLYALLQKDGLPNIKMIASRGNYRNMELLPFKPTYKNTYSIFFSGKGEVETSEFDQFSPLPFKTSIYERLKESDEKIYTGLVLSSPHRPEPMDSPSILLKLANPTIDIVKGERQRNAKGVSAEVLDILAQLKPPFFMFFNFVDVEYVGRRYREGAERYSNAVKKCDRELGSIIEYLKQSGTWETTEIFLTTNYGYKKRSQKKSNLIWIVSTKKIMRKGYSTDIVPAIYSLYDLEPDETASDLIISN
jgi:predicted AlkP superfamily pyrophosphatase or phosphodiesterase